MYEKPQYFTPEGFKRLPKNPYSSKAMAEHLELLRKKKRAMMTQLTVKKKPGITLSDEAAAAIAKVLSTMLHSRH
jgi:hypothetical protein